MSDLQYYSEKWPTPQSFGVGLFTDFRLYWEALEIANYLPTFSIEILLCRYLYFIRYFDTIQSTIFFTSS